jgi:hypothetical protein
MRGSTAGGWSVASSSKIAFSVNKPIKFAGITMFGGIIKSSTSNVTVKLYDGSTCVVTITKPFASSGTAAPIAIRADKPFNLACGQYYIIETIFDTKYHTYYGDSGLGLVQAEGITFTFQSVSGSQTTTSRGQIPQILFAK